MRATSSLLLLLSLSFVTPVVAQVRPQIPNGELPGRERDRFFDRFRQPGDLRNDPGIRWEGEAKSAPKGQRRSPKDGRRKRN